MNDPRTVLVQSISEYLAYLHDPVQALLEVYAHTGITEESVVRWVLAEEIESIYLLFDRTHQRHRNNLTYIHLYSELQGALPYLARLTSHHVKAPLLRGDNNLINLYLSAQDLFIEFDHPYAPVRFYPYS